MHSPENNSEYQLITFRVRKNSPISKRLLRLKNALEKIDPNARYGADRLWIDQMTESREEALKKGHSHFFNGVMCKNGHIAPRTKRGECNQCARDSANRRTKRKKKPDYKKITSFSRKMKLFKR